MSFREFRILRRVEEDPGTSVQRTAAAESIGVPFIRRILHERSLYTCHIQRVQAITPPDLSMASRRTRCKPTFCT
jgi:hypothetical protein